MPLPSLLDYERQVPRPRRRREPRGELSTVEVLLAIVSMVIVGSAAVTILLVLLTR